MDEEYDSEEIFFNNSVREYVVRFLVFIALYVTSYLILCAYKVQKTESDDHVIDAVDETVNRISICCCTFTLAVSLGAVLLLPLSIIANEAILMFKDSFYLQWVNDSLIQSLWSSVFLLSNLSLFILMPFAYLFTLSEGLPGSKKGIKSRFYETVLILFLLSILVIGIGTVVLAIVGDNDVKRKVVFNLWSFYLPLLYSCLSLIGVIVLLLCTPLGFTLLFDVIGELVIKPRVLNDLTDELDSLNLEVAVLNLKLKRCSNKEYTNGHINGSLSNMTQELDTLQRDIIKKNKLLLYSRLRRNFAYPIAMIVQPTLMAIAILMVLLNMAELLFGYKGLPLSSVDDNLVLGAASLSLLGPLGATVEVAVIIYLMTTSIVGFYSLPLINRIKPVRNDTSMVYIITNCSFIMILSSALPILSRTLGITNFDLLGNFGRFKWLGNFEIIFLYNFIFFGLTALCLIRRLTAPIGQAMFLKMKTIFIGTKVFKLL